MKRNFLIAAGLVFCIMGVRVLLGVPSWLKQRRESRQWLAVNDLTPERLIARCGPPAGDETKNLFPIVARDVSYKPGGGSTIVFKFSKTAEQSAEWVFTSMQDSPRGTAYESASDKIGALSCLDSTK
jgi:hypothetical protein